MFIILSSREGATMTANCSFLLTLTALVWKLRRINWSDVVPALRHPNESHLRKLSLQPCWWQGELTNFTHNRVGAARLEAQLGVNSRMICQRHRSFSSFSEESGRTGAFCCDRCMYQAERCMSCVMCMCCVQALFYPCATDQDGERGMGIDDPCSCNAPGKECLCRWSVLGILSIFMPCMVCYPFLRGFAKLFS